VAEVDATMSGTDALGESLRELRDFLQQRHWSHCLIGGLAAIRWGETRFTRDIDIVVFSGIGEEASYIDELLAAFAPRAEKSNVRQFALDNRVVLLTTHSGVPVDISLGALPFEEAMIARAKTATIVRGQEFQTASAEDIVVMKAIAGRAQDWRDIEGIAVKQGVKLDWDYIDHWLEPLLEIMERSERGAELQALRQRLASQPPSPLRAAAPKNRKSPLRKKRDS
jgi:hypothetical protein